MEPDSFLKFILQSGVGQNEHSPTFPIFISMFTYPGIRRTFHRVGKTNISVYLAGEKPRVRYRMLQLKKEKGGLGLPNLRIYYLATQIRPVFCLCSPSYNAKWKDIKGSWKEYL